VKVEDTGPGISEAEQQRLFTAYYRGEGDGAALQRIGAGAGLVQDAGGTPRRADMGEKPARQRKYLQLFGAPGNSESARIGC